MLNFPSLLSARILVISDMHLPYLVEYKSEPWQSTCLRCNGTAVGTNDYVMESYSDKVFVALQMFAVAL